VPHAPTAQDPGPSESDRALIIETLYRFAMAWNENNGHMMNQCFTDSASMTVTESGQKSLGTYETREAIASALTSELQIQDNRQRVVFNNPVVDDLDDRTALISAVFLVHGYRHFVADSEKLAATQRDVEDKVGRPELAYRRFGFNPLQKYPVVSGLGERWYMPVPHLLIRKASPIGVFFAGFDNFGKAFADDLGAQFEGYIGDNLRELVGTVVPEIEFGSPSQHKRSVDWIVIFEQCVLLVEVKSTRPTEEVRWGGPNAMDKLESLLGKAVTQLRRTADWITDRAFVDIPADRPIIGLVCTMEPFSMANAPFVADALPASDIPYRVCSAEEIEGLVRLHDDDIGSLLLDYMTHPERDGSSIKPLMVGREFGPNRLLDDAWNHLLWSDEASDTTETAPQ